MIENPPKIAGYKPARPGARASRPHKSWHSRGYLPHCDTPGLIQSITFRLEDSLPIHAVECLDAGTAPAHEHERVETLLAAGHGACWLARDDVAAVVENSLLHFDR